jgi:hypothetical protein
MRAAWAISSIVELPSVSSVCIWWSAFVAPDHSGWAAITSRAYA